MVNQCKKVESCWKAVNRVELMAFSHDKSSNITHENTKIDLLNLSEGRKLTFPKLHQRD